ncbi:MAG: VPLPA-CTERM sorting domain-containing protein [Gammaproteobacteria bacterium]|nr:VPLPA-CTERM sorting domain-containing protein [Gammaproteobacteria bacterium]
MKFLKLALTTTALVLSTSANASVIYQYTGNQYTGFLNDESDIYDTTMSITGFIEFESPLAPNLTVNGDESGNVTPISYSFSDGINTFTHLAPPVFEDFDIGTDSSGNITSWYIELWDNYPSSPSIGDTSGFMDIIGSNYYPDWGGGDQGNYGTCTEVQTVPYGVYCRTDQNSGWTDVPGTWSTNTSVVPIPAASWLFGSGLIGLVGLVRRKKA